jgi:hypothetical protein
LQCLLLRLYCTTTIDWGIRRRGFLPGYEERKLRKDLEVEFGVELGDKKPLIRHEVSAVCRGNLRS